MLVHLLHGLCTSHAKCAFLHGPHADDTFALPPTRFIGAGCLPPDSHPAPPGDTVPLEDDASPVR
jgi:hypothetical protein